MLTLRRPPSGTGAASTPPGQAKGAQHAPRAGIQGDQFAPKRSLSIEIADRIQITPAQAGSATSSRGSLTAPSLTFADTVRPPPPGRWAGRSPEQETPEAETNPRHEPAHSHVRIPPDWTELFQTERPNLFGITGTQTGRNTQQQDLARAEEEITVPPKANTFEDQQKERT